MKGETGSDHPAPARALCHAEARKGPVSLLCGLLALVLVNPSAQSQESWSKTAVTRGLIHHHIIKPGPYDIHLLEVDLSEPRLSLETYLAGGLTKTSEQASLGNRPGRKVLAAVNADFFSFKSHWPEGNQVRLGKVVIGQRSIRSHLIIDQFGKPHIRPVSFAGEFFGHNGRAVKVHGVNIVPGVDSLVVHTEQWFDKTGRWKCIAGVPIARVSGRWWIGDTLAFLVGQIGAPAGIGQRMHLCPGPGVELDKARFGPGDTVFASFRFSDHSGKVKEAIGGAGKILSNGAQLTAEAARGERIGEPFLTVRHPRTFVGFNKDTTRIWIGVVDGRQSTSIGMNYKEMGDLLLSLGVTEALNLDGGGSTTMVVKGRIINSPSDKAGERPVANILSVVEEE